MENQVGDLLKELAAMLELVVLSMGIAIDVSLLLCHLGKS